MALKSLPCALKKPIDSLAERNFWQQFKSDKECSTTLKAKIAEFHLVLQDVMHEHYNVSMLVKALSRFTDSLITHCWTFYLNLHADQDLTFIALGGYGRQELHPHSDIDCLILVKHQALVTHQKTINRLLQLLWDATLDISHSIRTLNNCMQFAGEDIAFMSNIMDARLLVGDADLFNPFKDAINAQKLWPDEKFFAAKWREQLVRDKKYGETAYNLEPNVKNSPGGLRDLQMIRWVTFKHFNTNNLHGLIKQHFLTQSEYHTLMQAQQFLWKVRFALHLNAKKREDRLLFDHQITLAKQFGYEDNTHRLGIEHFMQDYYRTIKTMRALNDMLLQLFREAIIQPQSPAITPINQRFQLNNRYIEVTDNAIFKNHPDSLLEIFILMGQNPSIRGVRASTIRLIRQNTHSINEQFRNLPLHRQQFMAILQQPARLSSILQRMNRYGILGRYIPEFGHIIGKMQYDLFHIYTVDQHTLFVIRNLRRFLREKYQKQFPLAYSIMRGIKKPEILYLSALFHDIGKGRKGDHSDIGASLIAQFAKKHYVHQEDVSLARWLVKNHLLMSLTAQRKDIYDPDVIREFCKKVKTLKRLHCLYLLTVADINATNPTLWNSWRDTLLADLLRTSEQHLTKASLAHDSEILKRKKQKALQILYSDGFNPEAIDNIWVKFKNRYFLMNTSPRIAEQTALILKHTSSDLLIHAQPIKDTQNTELFIYVPWHPHRFAITTTLLANEGINILEARFEQTLTGFSLESYIVLDPNHHLNNLKPLLKAHQHPKQLPRLSKKRLTRHQKHFKSASKIIFTQDLNRNRTALFLNCSDQPGLLAKVAKALLQNPVKLHNAKINTIGDKAEDTFYLTTEQDAPLDDALQHQIKLAFT